MGILFSFPNQPSRQCVQKHYIDIESEWQSFLFMAGPKGVDFFDFGATIYLVEHKGYFKGEIPSFTNANNRTATRKGSFMFSVTKRFIVVEPDVESEMKANPSGEGFISHR